MENNEREKGCFVGLQNQKELEKTNMRFEMIIDNLNQTIANLGATMEKQFDNLDKKMTDANYKLETSMETRFSGLNSKISKMDLKIDNIQETMPEKINEEVDKKLKNNLWNTIKWLIVTAGGSVSIAVITKFVLTLLIL